MAVGFRFNPFDDELIDYYLKPEIMGKQHSSGIIKHKQVYGPCSNPWSVFDSNDWFRSPSLKKTEMCVFVFAKLSKLSRSKAGTWKNTSKRAGCGTWSGKGKPDQIEDCDGNLIGEKRYLLFEINDVDSVKVGFDLSRVGQYKMYEYSLCGVNSGLINSDGTTVLCKIMYDPSKECQINRKSGAKISGKASKSSSQSVYEKEENNYNNVEGISSVSAGNLRVLDSDVKPVGYDDMQGTSSVSAENVSVLYSGVGHVGYDNVQGTNSVSAENLNVLYSGVGHVGYENMQGTSSVSPENLNVLDGGVGPVGYNNVEGTSCVLAENLTVLDGGFGPVGYNDVEGISCVLTENLTVLDSGLGPLAEWSAAQSNNDVLEFGDFCEGPNFDNLDGGFGFADSGENNLNDSDIDWIMDALDFDLIEEPSKDNSSSEFKRKFESEEDLNQSKRMCLDNPN